MNLFGRSPHTFSALEIALLGILRENLPRDLSERLMRQIAAINLVQRNSNDREVCCYARKRWGKSSRRPEDRFPNQSLELRFARITFSVPGVLGEWKAEFVSVQGRFFSIDFTPTPQSIQQRDDLVVKAVWLDPRFTVEVPEEQPPRSGGCSVKLTGWAGDWVSRYELVNSSPPLADAERQRHLCRIDAALPDDYLDLTRQCDGFATNSFGVLGLAEMYQIVLTPDDYFVIAVIGGDGVLAIKRYSTDTVLYYLDYSDSDFAMAMGASIQVAVEGALKETEGRP